MRIQQAQKYVQRHTHQHQKEKWDNNEKKNHRKNDGYTQYARYAPQHAYIEQYVLDDFELYIECEKFWVMEQGFMATLNITTRRTCAIYVCT